MNLSRAVTAGLIGGAVVDLFLILARVVPFPGVYQFIASTIVGPVAFTSSSYIALGLVMHFLISIAFALAYSFAAERSRALIDNPTLWGAMFGLAVYAVMEIVLDLAHAGQPFTVKGLIVGLVSHIVFFGLPVAWYVARSGRHETLAA
jgi:hypothetical protein